MPLLSSPPTLSSPILSCNFPSPKSLTLPPKASSISTLKTRTLPSPNTLRLLGTTTKARSLQTRRDSTGDGTKETVAEVGGASVERKGAGGGVNDWSTSILLFGLWAALIFYVVNLAPDQTPNRDFYFLQKLLNLKGDDGFRMNEVLVALWYLMAVWPSIYSMLLLPTGRSSQSKIPVWPFLVLSFSAGAYGLIPYFVLWKPPPPAVGEDELSRWPLNFLESKITAAALLAAGLGLILYCGLANSDVWKEFFQYFRESKLVHATCLDFLLLSAFAPFWVYNDMTARKWFDKGFWLLPVALIPILGPSLYLILRPPLSGLPTRVASTADDSE